MKPSCLTCEHSTLTHEDLSGPLDVRCNKHHKDFVLDLPALTRIEPSHLGGYQPRAYRLFADDSDPDEQTEDFWDLSEGDVDLAIANLMPITDACFEPIEIGTRLIALSGEGAN
jgi:hypothetical protein